MDKNFEKDRRFLKQLGAWGKRPGILPAEPYRPRWPSFFSEGHPFNKEPKAIPEKEEADA